MHRPHYHLLLLLIAGWLQSAAADESHQPFDFHTFYGTWSGNGEAYATELVQAARPQVVQIGWYGPMFHTYADQPKSTGYPMQLPVAGQAEALAVQREQMRELQATGAKVVGHFTFTNIIDGDGEAEELWLDFWEKRWDAELLGPRPEVDPRSLLQQDEEGKPLRRKHYHITYVGLCYNNPQARALMQQFLRVPLEAGVDGIITLYNYYWGCACEHCRASYGDWLKNQAGEAIEGPAFSGRVPAAIPGYPNDENGLSLSAQRWAAERFKAAWDELLIAHGRGRQPGLILATWNHLGHVGIGEERAFLPTDAWGRGEDYFWYSGGYGPTDLANDKLGDGWLNSLYIRALSGDKPFVLGKYEAVRLRNSLAEGWATGGAGTGLYLRVNEPEGMAHAVAYMRFANQHRELLASQEPWAEIALLLPREAVQAGNAKVLEAFRREGERLAAAHRLFKIVTEPVEGLPMVDYTASGTDVDDTNEEREFSRVEAPSTVRIAGYRLPDGYTLHIVNYNRDEAATEKPRAPAHEHPIAVEGITMELRIAEPIASARLLTPEAAPQALEFTQADGVLTLTVPRVTVYAVVHLQR